MNIDFNLPELGENIASGDVVSVLVREGDVIAANDGVVELETDKAVVEIPCPYAGKVTKVHVAKGQTLKVGQPVLSVEMEAEDSCEAASGARKAAARGDAGEPAKSPHPSPLPEGEGTEEAALYQRERGPSNRNRRRAAGPDARRLARELGVDLSQVQGSGKSRADHRRGRPRRGRPAARR